MPMNNMNIAAKNIPTTWYQVNTLMLVATRAINETTISSIKLIIWRYIIILLLLIKCSVLSSIKGYVFFAWYHTILLLRTNTDKMKRSILICVASLSLDLLVFIFHHRHSNNASDQSNATKNHHNITLLKLLNFSMLLSIIGVVNFAWTNRAYFV